jgi:flagellar protein FliS
LDALYAYMSQRLAMANIRNQPELVTEVIKLLTDLKTAWETIGDQATQAPVLAATLNSAPTALSKEQSPASLDGRVLRYAGA